MKTLITSILLFFCLTTMGQDKEKTAEKSISEETVTIIVDDTNPDNSKRKIKKYKLQSKDSLNKNEWINHLLDSVGIDQNDDRRITIIIDGNGYTENKPDHMWRFQEFRHIQKNVDSLLAQFDHDIIKPGKAQFEYQIRPQIKSGLRSLNETSRQSFDFFNDSFLPSTIQSLEVYPNNPDNGYLNVRFKAPEKGNVNIVMTDVNGKEIASEKLKEFQGNYLGQVAINKKAKGTIFVNVTQNNDGAVKRVVLK